MRLKLNYVRKNFLMKTCQTCCVLIQKKCWKLLCPKIANVFPVVIANDGSVLSTTETATQFNSFSSSVFTIEEPFMDGTVAADVMSDQMSNIVTNTHGVGCAIDRLPTYSDPGPDGISTKLLKIAKDFSSIFLGKIFQQSVTIGCLPND